MSYSYLRVTWVSAQACSKGLGKLVFLYTFAADCICGEAATEETSVSEVRLHPSTPVTQRFFQGSFIYAVFKVQVLADLSADGDEEIRTLDQINKQL